MNYLLDVNVLVAWGWSDHVDHDRTTRWIAGVKRQRAAKLLTSAVPELGFVRVSVQRASGRVTVEDACETLESMLNSLGASRGFLDDNLGSTSLPGWCTHASRTTDAHLFELAKAHGASLATLDKDIPGAFLIPSPPTKE
jgi:predicted nucleic acid-binding protein